MAKKENQSKKNQGNVCTSNKTNSKQNKALITNDFFPDGISVNENEVFPMVVVATMSSGKSTLINALLGQQVLPSKNKACTAKMYSILDDDKDTETRIYITDDSGNTTVKRANLAEVLERANEDETVTDILIRGHVKGVLNTDKALLIVDTPGPNNSRDESHEKIMNDVLKKINGGLLLYVLNATQFGINDDKYLLDTIREYIKNNDKMSLVFAVNKVDQLDEERGESVGRLILTAKEYLEKNGINNPQIIPVSAMAASLFKKVINEEELTRSEYIAFCNYYDIYEPTVMHIMEAI